MVFFAPNKRRAIHYAKAVAKREGLQYVEPKIAKKQIPHINRWKTWTSGWR